MNRVLLGGLLLLSSGCATASANKPAPVAEVPSADLKQEVQDFLAGKPRVPTEEDWKRMGPQALTELESVYRDPKAAAPMRLRAVACMSQVFNPLAVHTLRTIVLDSRAEVPHRSAAAQALGFRAGTSEAETLTTLLAEAHPQLREAAARALGQLSSPEAKQALEARLEIEDEAVVREAIQKSLTAMEP